MEVIVLGGAGDMGSRAVEDLAISEGVRRVTIADRNVSAARQIAARMADQGAEVGVRPIDANNHLELVEAMRGYDVAASALGPFYLSETKLVRAAIEAGVDYASICDDGKRRERPSSNSAKRPGRRASPSSQDWAPAQASPTWVSAITLSIWTRRGGWMCTSTNP